MSMKKMVKNFKHLEMQSIPNMDSKLRNYCGEMQQI
jgi:hypothetical protein